MMLRTCSLALATLALVACAGDGTGPATFSPSGDHTANACDHDTTAPTVTSTSASPNTLWPPNHEMVPVTVGVVASDACSGTTSTITNVTSNEPVNGIGDGNTSPDWAVTGALTLLVRAERAGPLSGRIYTITVETRDAAGNVTTTTTTVTVPHDQGAGNDGGQGGTCGKGHFEGAGKGHGKGRGEGHCEG